MKSVFAILFTIFFAAATTPAALSEPVPVARCTWPAGSEPPKGFENALLLWHQVVDSRNYYAVQIAVNLGPPVEWLYVGGWGIEERTATGFKFSFRDDGNGFWGDVIVTQTPQLPTYIQYQMRGNDGGTYQGLFELNGARCGSAIVTLM